MKSKPRVLFEKKYDYDEGAVELVNEFFGSHRMLPYNFISDRLFKRLDQQLIITELRKHNVDIQEPLVTPEEMEDKVFLLIFWNRTSSECAQIFMVKLIAWLRFHFLEPRPR